jgi:molybdenum cofactor synthesis domain-containing protein
MQPQQVIAAVVVVSDRSAAGERPDASGPVAVSRLLAAGFWKVELSVVPDGELSVERALRKAIDAGARFIVTSGGTGVAPRDQTPEGTRPVIDRHLPGIPELLRRDGSWNTPTAVLSRGLAGISESGALIINLPGSPAAVGEGLDVLLPLVPHLLEQLAGKDHS